MKKALYFLFIAILTAIVCGIVTVAQGMITLEAQPSGVSYTIPIVIFDSNSPWRLYGTMPDACDVYVYQDFTSGARATNSVTDRGDFGSLVLTAAEMTGSIGILVDVNDDTDPPLFGDSIIYIPIKSNPEDSIWDELFNGGAHRIKNSAADLLRRAASGGGGGNSGSGDNIAVEEGTARGGTSNTITLAANASSKDNIYQGLLVNISGGTGYPQTRVAVTYSGGTKILTVDKNWVTVPTTSSNYQILADAGSIYSDQGTAQAGDVNSITLASTASDSNSVYDGFFVRIISGTGADQVRTISNGTGNPSYDGTSKLAYVTSDWDTSPDNTSVYVVIPGGNVVSDSSTLNIFNSTYNNITESNSKGAWNGRGK